jgi:hypothetical protein
MSKVPISKDPEHIRELINNIQEKLAQKKYDLSLNLVLFGIVCVVLILFLIFLVRDLAHTVSLYFKKSKGINSVNERRNDDNYGSYINPLLTETNELNRIEENIVTHTHNQSQHLESIRLFKLANDLPQSHIEGQIDLTTLNEDFDNYTYDPNKNGFSFWEMLLMPPDFSKYVTKRTDVKPYIEI